MGCAGKNHVFHLGAPQGPDTLFAQRPADGIRYVALATAIWPDDGIDTRTEFKFGLVSK